MGRSVTAVVEKGTLQSNVIRSIKMIRVNMVESEACKEAFYVNNITGKDETLVSLKVNDAALVKFQIDTGSTTNILPLGDYIRATKYISGDNIDCRNITFVMHDKSKSKALGRVRVHVEFNGSKHDLNFMVMPLLSLKASQGMGLIKIMNCDEDFSVITESVKQCHEAHENAMKVLSEYATDVFQELGCLPGEYSIMLDETVPPVIILQDEYRHRRGKLASSHWSLSARKSLVLCQSVPKGC